ncbi:hypothetical protein F5Y19DRAFT_270008 [Xylariaceae sp. FL1651]|nr:hypothetical protein F5Y19DRAFT_270008 [Xylariaceae sp. FL1651]
MVGRSISGVSCVLSILYMGFLWVQLCSLITQKLASSRLYLSFHRDQSPPVTNALKVWFCTGFPARYHTNGYNWKWSNYVPRSVRLYFNCRLLTSVKYNSSGRPHPVHGPSCHYDDVHSSRDRAFSIVCVHVVLTLPAYSIILHLVYVGICAK